MTRWITPQQVGEEIISRAEDFTELYEVKANAEWAHPVLGGAYDEARRLRLLMEHAGWHVGWPYCAAFVEAMWRATYAWFGAPAALLAKISARLTPSVMQSFSNWAGEITRVPQPGAIVFMQLGDGWRGHAGLVAEVGFYHVATIEGNTSPDPDNPDADRDGDGIFRRVRALRFTPSSGLWLRGFLNPIGFRAAGEPEIRPDHLADWEPEWGGPNEAGAYEQTN